MLKLFNLSTHPVDLEKFGQETDYIKNVEQFIRKHGFDGIELIQNPEWKESILPSRLIRGLHMRFWPIWLDFWRGDAEKLAGKFGSMEDCRNFYGGESRQVMVDYYRRELAVARDIGVKYVVFHVSNVEPEHCFNYNFTYTSEMVIESCIELVNEVFAGITPGFDLLFENLWWPGLTLTDSGLAARLLEGVEYPRKGFMLDVGHLANTNTALRSEKEVVEYILKTLQGLGEMAGCIKGIHLNSAVSGEYVREQIARGVPFKGGESFMERYIEAYKHILKIDTHIPFKYASIKKVIDFVSPEYLVYEVLTETLEKLEEYAAVQDEVLGCID